MDTIGEAQAAAKQALADQLDDDSLRLEARLDRERESSDRVEEGGPRDEPPVDPHERRTGHKAMTDVGALPVDEGEGRTEPDRPL